ncbi:MAG TPA: glycosyltransferase family 39 protein [Devosia sp.]|nr:glycosyltransferase family 39 protein [Devosia sp.]
MDAGPAASRGWVPLNLLAAALLAAIVVLAASLRFGFITSQSLWWDEVVTWQQSRLPFCNMLAATAADNYPPLYNILAMASMALFGETELGLRLPSALLGTLNIIAIYWVGRLAAGRPAGLLAALLLALSPYHLWYSNEARMYALLACAATVLAGTMLSFAERPRWWMGLASILAAVSLLYSHPYGALTWGAICLGIVLLLARDLPRLLTLAGLQLVAMFAFIPWIGVLLARAANIQSAGFWIQPVTPWSLFQLLVQLTSGPFLFAAIVVGIRLAFGRPAPLPLADTERPQLPLILAFHLTWALLPILAGAVLSWTIQPMLISRYVIGSLPPLFILTAIGFLRLPRGRAGKLGLGALAVAVIIAHFAYNLRPRDDLRGLAAWLELNFRPTDCFIMIPEAAIGLSYYHRDPLPCVATFRTIADVTDLGSPGRVFVFETLSADVTGFERLGEEVGRMRFGPSTLIELRPR